jgi:lipopolysaccharide/colanic/teichoic acid biosynthesis glycosyltransferase
VTGVARHPWQARAKRLLDPLAAALLIVLFSPVLLGVTAWILVESGRPVLFVRPRAGLGGRPFEMLKFRSMIPDALEVGRRLELSADPFGIVNDDPRITRSGRFLRRTGLDELPQLFNVLRGEMSLVGPRPDLVEQAANYAPDDARRLLVKPGITGWAQVHGREDMTWPERFRMDAWYIEHWSLPLDLRILFRTIGQFFRPEPTYVEDELNIERAKLRAAKGALRQLDADEWDAFLAETGNEDPLVSSGYVRAGSLLDPGRPAFHVLEAPEGSVGLGTIVREIPGEEGLADATSPYGYGGPVVAGERPPLEGFYAERDRWCAENGVVATFLRFHPFLENRSEGPPGTAFERLADLASWRLDGGDDLFAGMHRSHRNKCRKAEAAGIGFAATRGPQPLGDFVALHHETMRRLDAEDFYFFPLLYWELLAETLGERFVRFDARLDEELAASAVCLVGGAWMHYHMAVVSDAGRSVGAANALVYEIAKWGREQGFSELLLGAGHGGVDSPLAEFKRRFTAGHSREYWIGKVVHDPDAYRRLGGDPDDLSGFFPAYRAQAALETAG